MNSPFNIKLDPIKHAAYFSFAGWVEEQLHVLRGVQAPGPGQGSHAGQEIRFHEALGVFLT